MKKLPLLNDRSKKFCYPTNGKCPVCGASFKQSGFAFISANVNHHANNGIDLACLLKEIEFKSYFYFGYHGAESMSSQLREGKEEMYEVVDIVDGLRSSSFEICFCSIRCMRNWFNAKFDDFVDKLSEEYGYEP